MSIVTIGLCFVGFTLKSRSKSGEVEGNVLIGRSWVGWSDAAEKQGEL